MDRNRAIGSEGDLPWHIPEDLAHFKATTMGKPIIMGRATWESIGRPLPGRTNIVLSTTLVALGGAAVCGDLDSALAVAAAEKSTETMVIGGEQIYRLALPRADRLYLTTVDTEVEGADCWFPEIGEAAWYENERRELPATRDRWHLKFQTLDRLK